QYSEFGSLAGHVRWCDRASRRLARQLFHLMAKNGPALERRQALLFRCVDVGAELFAMLATCVRALDDVKKDAGDRSPLELADVLRRHAGRKVEKLFADVGNNADVVSYHVAKGILEQRFVWLENGIVDAPEAAPAESPAVRAAAGK